MREIVNGIFSVLRGGMAWRLLPKDLPPKSTVYGYFSTWRDSGLFSGINHHLVMLDPASRRRSRAPAGVWHLEVAVGLAADAADRGPPAGLRVSDTSSPRSRETNGRGPSGSGQVGAALLHCSLEVLSPCLTDIPHLAWAAFAVNPFERQIPPVRAWHPYPLG
jgi:transposase